MRKKSMRMCPKRATVIKHVLEKVFQVFPFTAMEFFECMVMIILLVISIYGTAIALTWILEVAMN